MKIKIVVLDQTQYWAESITARAGQVFGVYYFDPEVAVHCCEMTPSHELHFLNSVPRDLPEDENERERLINDISDGDIGTDPITYVHCRDIEKMPAIERGHLERGVYDMPHEWEDEEEFEEHWRGNPDY